MSDCCRDTECHTVARGGAERETSTGLKLWQDTKGTGFDGIDKILCCEGCGAIWVVALLSARGRSDVGEYRLFAVVRKA